MPTLDPKKKISEKELKKIFNKYGYKYQLIGFDYIKSELEKISKTADAFKKSNGLGSFNKLIESRKEINQSINNITLQNTKNKQLDSDILINKDQLKKIILETVKEVLITENNIKDNRDQIILDQEGNLYREPMTKFLYELHKEDKRLQLLKLLNSNFQKVEILLNSIDYKNKSSLVSAIGKINQKAKYRLKIKYNIIEGRKGSGYRINHLCFIKRL